MTGYRPFGNIKPDYEMVAEYESLAERAEGERADKKIFDELLKSFVAEALMKEKVKKILDIV